MAYETISVERHSADERVAHVQLDRVERNNVLDSQVLAELHEAFLDADRDPDVEGILLGSTGDPFCAGAALEELEDLSVAEGVRFLTAYFETLEILRDTGKPAVAAVEGTCVAGGNELVMACDLVVAGEGARFGQPEVGVGSTAGAGGAQLLPLIVGEKRARELLLTGTLLDADEAERYGLINRVVDAGAAESAALDLVVEIVETSSPQAYRTIKAMLKPWTNVGMSHQETARDLTAHVWASDEFRERAAAFLAREEQAARHFEGTQSRRSDD